MYNTKPLRPEQLYLACNPDQFDFASTDQLEELVTDLVEKTLDPCRDALEADRVKPEEVDQVILVGGQTRMPLVVTTVSGFFGRTPCQDINPDEVVGIDAAIQAGILQGDLHRLHGTLDQVFHQRLQLGARQFHHQVLGTGGIGRDVRQVNFGLLR